MTNRTAEDMLVSLSQEVAQLKRQLVDLRAGMAKKEDVEKFANAATEADYKAGQALTTSKQFAENIEMLIDDVVMLDERTQELTGDGMAELGGEIVRVVLRHLEREATSNERD